MRHAKAAIVSFGRHAARASVAAPASARGDGFGPFRCHLLPCRKGLLEGFESARRRFGAAAEIHAVLARQSGQGDAELAKFDLGQLERGGGATSHCNRSASDRPRCQKSQFGCYVN